jgi:hypothetical protein
MGMKVIEVLKKANVYETVMSSIGDEPRELRVNKYYSFKYPNIQYKLFQLSDDEEHSTKHSSDSQRDKHRISQLIRR